MVADADYVDLATAAELLRTHGVLLAAGEKHFTRDEFRGLLEAGAVECLQPDLSEAGGFTETARIAALASAWGLRIQPHTSMRPDDAIGRILRRRSGRR